MELMRQSWTDDRLDDLNEKVDRIDADIRGQRLKMKTEFTSVRSEMQDEFRALRGEMKAGFDRIDERFEALYRLILQLGSAAVVALVGLVATQL